MPSEGIGILARVMTDEQDTILTEWFVLLKQTGVGLSGRIRDAELQAQARTVLDRVQGALASVGTDREDEARARLDEELGEISRSRALQGFTSADTANFVFSLKEPLFEALNRLCTGMRRRSPRAAWRPAASSTVSPSIPCRSSRPAARR